MTQPSATPTAGPASAHSTQPVRDPAPTPALADVIGALDEAACSLKAVVRNQTTTARDEINQFVRDQPLTALALAGGLGYLVARLTR